MRRAQLAIAFSVLLAACADGPTQTPDPQFDLTGQGVHRYIVRFRDTEINARGETDRVIAENAGRLAYRYEHALKGFAGDFSARDIAAVAADPRVLSVEPDQIAYAIGTQLNPPSWGLDRVDQVDLPLSSSYIYNATGTGVRAYIIDTGIRFTHNDFGGRASSGFDAITPGGNAADCNGHGTHVAGTVGGSTYGVAKNVSLIAVRVLDCSGSGTYSQVIAGVDWVTQQKQANPSIPMVANMSLGGGVSSALNAAVTNSINAGVTYAVAAGNDYGVDACLRSPASTPSALTVGATTNTDARATYSNIGTCLDLFAPGSSIVSAYYTSNTATATLSGTSMAAPHVAGAAALYLEGNPTASPTTVMSALLNNASLNKVTNPGTGSPNRLLYTGFIQAPGPNNPPVAVATVSCVNMTCTFDGSQSTDDHGIVAYEWHPGGPGIISTQPVFTYTFSSARTRTWSLVVRDAGGLTSTASVTFTVPANPPAPPVANFTYSCTHLACSFDASSSTAQPTATYSWSWGDGSPNGSGRTASHTFAAAGTYGVVLYVTDAGGSDSTFQAVTVTAPPANQAPVAIPTVTCSGMTCTFDGTASTDDVGITAYEWRPGGPSIISTQPVFTYTFSAGRTRTWTLTVRDAGGLSHTASVTFTTPAP